MQTPVALEAAEPWALAVRAPVGLEAVEPWALAVRAPVALEVAEPRALVARLAESIWTAARIRVTETQERRQARAEA